MFLVQSQQNMVPFLTICCTVLLPTALAQITQPPSNVAGRVGNSVNITCRASLPSQGPDGFEWLEFVTVAEGRRIFSDPAFDNTPLDETKYGIHGQYDLEVKELQVEDGGNYGCKMFSDASPRGAHLFVFDTFTLTSTLMKEGDTLNISCDARFGASPRLSEDLTNIPEMMLMVNGVQVPGLVTMFTESTTSEPFMIRGYAPYTARSQDSGEDFVCMLTVNDPFNYQAMDTRQMDIHFGARAPTFAPRNPSYYVGDIINCTAEGSPTPDYQWESIYVPGSSDIMVIEGEQLVISEEMITDPDNQEDRNRWKCIASNEIGTDGEPVSAESEIEFTVMARDGNTGSSTPKVAGWKIGVGVGVPIAIIFIALAIFLGIWYYRKQKALKNNNEKPPPDFGADNRGAAFPGDMGDLSNGLKSGPPVSPLPNPLPEDVPANRSRDSPGYADLGVKQISNSYPGVNVSMSSVDSFDDSRVDTPLPPPPTNQRPPPSHVNPSFQSSSPPRQQRPAPAARPTYLNVGEPQPPVNQNHPDTFV